MGIVKYKVKSLLLEVLYHDIIRKIQLLLWGCFNMFIWKESFTSQIAKFDDQHKKLFDLGNKLYFLVKNESDQDNYDEIVQTLDDLKEYTVYHFQSEESLMEQYKYPKLLSHKIEHEAFIRDLNELLDTDVDENQTKVSLEILQFIANWIENHILKSDSQYGDFLKSKGIS